jgi:hypothetical protein
MAAYVRTPMRQNGGNIAAAKVLVRVIWFTSREQRADY